MNDRFAAHLRQHLVDTADERPADGQLTSIVEHVAVTGQRRVLPARLTWFPRQIGPFASDAVRFGLVVLALVLATVAVIVFAGGTQPSGSTVFEGRWTATDQPDGSTLNLYVGAGSTPTVRFEDLHATGDACLNDEVKVFTAEGVGEITRERLEATFPNGGGCGLETVSLVGTYVYDPDADTLLDQDGLIWKRVRGGNGPAPTLPPGPSPFSPGPVFEGRWTAPDPGDESTLTLIVGEGIAPTVQFQDDLATGQACVADEVKIFRADGVGEITGNRLIVSYPDGGGCGLMLLPIGGAYRYDAKTGTLTDQDDVSWTRVPAGIEPTSSLRPAPSPTPRRSTPACIDLGQGGTFTAPVGSMSVTATIPSTPEIRWQGSADRFLLSSSCAEIARITFFALPATSVYETSCMPDALEITSFADALARLDTPVGDDISDRIDLTIDGHLAARYDVSSLTTCPGGFGLWHGTAIGRGETGSVYVIDVDGVLVAIELNRDGSQSPAELEEAWAIIASIQFQP